jgi:hypothetical protein
MKKTFRSFQLNTETLISSNSSDFTKTKYFLLSEEVRAAFEGIVDNLFDHILVTVNTTFFTDNIRIKLTGASYCFPDSFKFLAKSSFNFRETDKEPWSLDVETDDDFGIDWGVGAKTARLCVLAMIREKQKEIIRVQKDLNKFPKTEKYTYQNYSC